MTNKTVSVSNDYAGVDDIEMSLQKKSSLANQQPNTGNMSKVEEDASFADQSHILLIQEEEEVVVVHSQNNSINLDLSKITQKRDA